MPKKDINQLAAFFVAQATDEDRKPAPEPSGKAKAGRLGGKVGGVARALVKDTSRVGEGFPDLLVLHRERLYMIEVKDGSKPPSERKLTDDQVAFVADGWPVQVVTSEDEALRAIGVKHP